MRLQRETKCVSLFEAKCGCTHRIIKLYLSKMIALRKGVSLCKIDMIHRGVGGNGR